MHHSYMLYILLTVGIAAPNVETLHWNICDQSIFNTTINTNTSTIKKFHNAICMKQCNNSSSIELNNNNCQPKYCTRKNEYINETNFRLHLWNLDSRLNFFYKHKQCSWLFTNANATTQPTYLIITKFNTKYANDFLFIYNQSMHANTLLASINNQLQAEGERLIIRLKNTPKLLLMLNINNLINNTFDIEITYKIDAINTASQNFSKHRTSFIQMSSDNQTEISMDNDEMRGNETLEADLRRSFHKTLAINNTVYVIGGYFQQQSIEYSPSFGLTYSLLSGEWHQLANRNPSIEPRHRFAHTLTHDQQFNRLIVFGGIISHEVTNEMWLYDFGAGEWQLHEPEGLVKPIAVAGHSSVIIGAMLYNFFGYSSKQNAYLSQLVQVYDLEKSSWRVLKIAADIGGGVVKIGYKHASVFDASTGLVYLFGGMMLGSTSTNNFLSNALYEFDWRTERIRALKIAKHSMFLHTGMLHGEYLVFIAGKAFNTFNPLNNSLGDIMSSFEITRKIQLYHIGTETWFMLNASNTALKRYAHSHFIVNSTHYGLFAGYNGLFLDDIAFVNISEIVTSTLNEFNDFEMRKNESIMSRIDEAQMFALALVKRMDPCAPYSDCRSCYLNNFNCTWRVDECVRTPVSLYNNTIDIAERCGGDLTRNNSYLGMECRVYNSCGNCTQMDHCMWCASSRTCFNRNSIRILYHFGECMNYVTDRAKCDLTHECSFYSDCNRCIRDEKCGWCNLDNPHTGRGVCVDGNSDSSFNRSFCYAETESNRSNWFFSKCPACQCNGHATCETNSSRCLKCGDNTINEETDGYVDTSEYVEEDYYYWGSGGAGGGSSSGLVVKSQCAKCAPGYYGDARNGGTCAKCRCNAKQSNYCDAADGRCFCFTKGVTGKLCSQCESPRYWGNPMANNGFGTCFYELSTDYQFTFNLNKESDKHFTRINFSNSPQRLDDDIDFVIKCFKDAAPGALFNLTYSATPGEFRAFGIGLLNSSLVESLIPPVGERVLLSGVNCTGTEFKYTFSPRNNLNLIAMSNLTLFVYVYQFKTPIAIQISFSYRSKIQIFHFFLTFFGCFVSLLAFAFVFWKSKQRFDRYRRQRRMMHEMREMANRPFVKLVVSLDGGDANLASIPVSDSDGLKLDSSDNLLEKKVEVVERAKEDKSSRFDALNLKRFFHMKSVAAKKGHGVSTSAGVKRLNAVLVQNDKQMIEHNIMPVALEPLETNKVAIASVLIRPPKASYASKASSPFLIGSTLVAINVLYTFAEEGESKEYIDVVEKSEEAV